MRHGNAICVYFSLNSTADEVTLVSSDIPFDENDETNKIWLIKGSMRELTGGGVPYALITIDGKVLAIWHTR